MKTQEKKPEAVSHTLQAKSGKTHQPPATAVLQAYKEGVVQREAEEEEESLQMKSQQSPANAAVLQAYKEGIIQREAEEEEEPLQMKNNQTGLPDNLKSGVEALSGYSMDDVRVHFNSSQPAQFQALAYTQGTNIHVAPGQEQHLAHEAWHVVQQKQGRVRPTMQMKGVQVNDDQGLEREADYYGELALSGRSNDNPPLLSKGIQNPSMQMFRIVQPRDEDYHLDNSFYPLFSTHKVVHSDTVDNRMENNSTDINPELKGLMREDTNNIIKIEEIETNYNFLNNSYRTYEPFMLYTIHEFHPILTFCVNNFIEVCHRFLTQIIEQIREEKVILDILYDSILDKRNNNNMPIEQKMRSVDLYKEYCGKIKNTLSQAVPFLNFVLSEYYKIYFKHVGKTADPQRRDKTLGSEEYKVKGGETNNTLRLSSRFYVTYISSNEHYPLLVSENNRFAINAFYSDPKEVYMTDEAATEANASLMAGTCVLYPTSNHIFLGGEKLNMYKPQFILNHNNDQNNPNTSICNEIRDRYYKENRRGLLDTIEANGSLSFVATSQVPWRFHVAGTLVIDGQDKLSLENGARAAWIKQRGNQTLGAFAITNELVNEMFKTWYFRIYGSLTKKQDIKEQTLARFLK